jgi:acyl carrier protein
MAITRDEAARLIEGFIREEFHVHPADGRFTRDTHLYDAGFVDSTGVVELIAFIESIVGVEIPDDELFSDAFTTINGISGVVQRLSNGGGSVQGRKWRSGS